MSHTRTDRAVNLRWANIAYMSIKNGNIGRQECKIELLPLPQGLRLSPWATAREAGSLQTLHQVQWVSPSTAKGMTAPGADVDGLLFSGLPSVKKCSKPVRRDLKGRPDYRGYVQRDCRHCTSEAASPGVECHPSPVHFNHGFCRWPLMGDASVPDRTEPPVRER
jgi:hypothetical protein